MCVRCMYVPRMYVCMYDGVFTSPLSEKQVKINRIIIQYIHYIRINLYELITYVQYLCVRVGNALQSSSPS